MPDTAIAPPPPSARLSVGFTGHRDGNAVFAANRAGIEAVIVSIFATMDGVVAQEAMTLGQVETTRLHCLLADGADQMAAAAASVRGWELVAPLPFGRQLNLSINALPQDASDARILLSGGDVRDPATQQRAQAITQWSQKARLFELAERDDAVAALHLAKLDAPADLARAQAFTAHVSERVALAGRVMIEQSDIVIGIWDGVTSNLIGGTGHTIATALELGAPVIRIDPSQPNAWHILRAPESLAAPPANEDREMVLADLVRSAIRPGEGGAMREGAGTLGSEAWHPHNNRWWNGYRRIEAVFGGDGRPFRSLHQVYETPEQIALGSGARTVSVARELSDGDGGFVDRIETAILKRFAWADGISARLSDSYRGGMIANFVLSALAVVTGIAYQPFAQIQHKWMFASIEFLFLSTILLITWLGVKWRWHRRWFETRRVAEYLRHAPILLLLGVARSPGRWPRGARTSWPEYYARAGLREVGLPQVAITPTYLRTALNQLLDDHVVRQRDYHVQKAKKLTSVHHKLDRLSERLFQLAVVSVATYLALAGAVALGVLPQGWLKDAAKIFTFFGVMFPTFGASIAGMRYFGDFERFAAISEVTAEKLEGVHTRTRLLLSAPDDALDYARAAELAHAMDAIVVTEIENWQAVFGGKQITVPV